MTQEDDGSTPRTNRHIYREAWLDAALIPLRRLFKEHGHTLDKKIRMAIGFTGGGRRSNLLGQVWRKDKSAGGYFELYIMPTIADSYDVLSVFTSLLIITLAGDAMAPYKQIASAIGMNWDKKKPAAEGKLMRRLNVIADELGPLPHDALDIRATAVGLAPTQATRQLLAVCPKCRIKIQLTQLAIDTAGLPICRKDGMSFNLPGAEEPSGDDAAVGGNASLSSTGSVSEPSLQPNSQASDTDESPSAVFGAPSATEEAGVPISINDDILLELLGSDQDLGDEAVADGDQVSVLPDSASEARLQHDEPAIDGDEPTLSDADASVAGNAADRPRSNNDEVAFTLAPSELNPSDRARARKVSTASTGSPSEPSPAPVVGSTGNGDEGEAMTGDNPRPGSSNRLRQKELGPVTSGPRRGRLGFRSHRIAWCPVSLSRLPLASIPSAQSGGV